MDRGAGGTVSGADARLPVRRPHADGAIAREGHLLRVELSRKILDPLGIRTDYKVGELLSISSGDADETAYLLDYVPRIVGAVVATIACGAVLLTIDLPLGLMVLIGVPVVVAALQLTAPIIARRVEDQQAEIGRATALATDLISGHRPLQGIGAQRNAAARYRVASRRSLSATLRAARIQSAHAGAAAAAGALAAMAVAVVAGYFAISGDAEPRPADHRDRSGTVPRRAVLAAGDRAELGGRGARLGQSRCERARLAKPPRCAHDPARSRAGHPRRPDRCATATHASLAGLSLEVLPGEFVAVLTADARDADRADGSAVRAGTRTRKRNRAASAGDESVSCHTASDAEACWSSTISGDLFSGTLVPI